MSIETVSEVKAHGGVQGVYRHASVATGTDMVFSLFMPREVERGEPLPVLWYLSGLTCSHANVTEKGEFVWHKHDDSDELFLVIEGELDIEFRDRTVKLKPGELIVVPRGTEHRPVSRNGETKLLLIDPKDAPNTGDEATATKAIEI